MNSLRKLLYALEKQGVEEVYVKSLADNDNSKNQVYFGPDLSSLNIFPLNDVVSADSGTHKKPILKAALSFGWLQDDGSVCPAPRAQLIFYPQYPEVRFSGFLRGCPQGPSGLMRPRLAGRLLFLGVDKARRRVIGYIVHPSDPIRKEFDDLDWHDLDSAGVFSSLPVDYLEDRKSAKQRLLDELKRIHKLGWIESKRLRADGSLVAYSAPNAGGYTLEAELGIVPNSRAEPDIFGWEIKQYGDRNSKLTLMTPEPTGGIYADPGVVSFVRRFGKPKQGANDVLYFTGSHRLGRRHNVTSLVLALTGFDEEEAVIVDPSKGLALLTPHEEVAALWPYSGLIEHWNRKHERAVYVPSEKRDNPRGYEYGKDVLLCEGTEFQLFLQALVNRQVFYDPGVKIEAVSSSSPTAKKRNQFRIAARDVPCLYRNTTTVDVTS